MYESEIHQLRKKLVGKRREAKARKEADMKNARETFGKIEKVEEGKIAALNSKIRDLKEQLEDKEDLKRDKEMLQDQELIQNEMKAISRRDIGCGMGVCVC